MVSIGEFVNKTFESRQKTHLDHLSTKSYAQHVALNDFYDSILDLNDDLIETYQGQYGLIDIPKIIVCPSVDSITYLQELHRFIYDNRGIFKPEDSHLQNIIDEMVALVNRTLYKLINLK